MTERLDISIIGPGKVGTAIGALAAQAGWCVAAVGGRDASKTRAAANQISPEAQACPLAEAAARGRLVLLTVSDNAIQAVCEELAGRGAFQEGSIVAHCSGALGSEILSAARNSCGCLVASMHPLQTFPTVAAVLERLPDAHFFCEGDDEAVGVLERLVSDIAGRFVRIDPAGKVFYHAGAVMACNYLTALVDAGIALMQRAGIERQEALESLLPLIRATVENIAALGTQDALTGPIARGDIETVKRHLQAISDDKELEALYRAAGFWTAGLARNSGTIDDATFRALCEEMIRREDG